MRASLTKKWRGRRGEDITKEGRERAVLFLLQHAGWTLSDGTREERRRGKGGEREMREGEYTLASGMVSF